MRKALILLFSIGTLYVLPAQREITISVVDQVSGEDLVGAYIVQQGTANEAVWQDDKHARLSLQADWPSKIITSYVGYNVDTTSVSLTTDSIIISLQRLSDLSTVVVEGRGGRTGADIAEMGVVRLGQQEIEQIPALFGEVDVLKAVQLLPGIQSAGEGNTGYNVRGGGADQNLVLWDDAVIYNPGHLLGFFSVFNTDVVDYSEIYKGSPPVQYVGRLSSVLDVRSVEPRKDRWDLKADLGLVSSKFTLQGPIVKDKLSVLIGARRTYILDIAQGFINNTDFAGTNYYFYDGNLKIDWRLSDHDQITMSNYAGEDRFSFRTASSGLAFDLPYGSSVSSLSWRRLWSDRTQSTLSLTRSAYSFELSGGQEGFQFALESGIRDLGADWQLTHQHGSHVVKTGLSAHHLRLTPNILSATIEEVEFSPRLSPKYGLQLAWFLEDRWSITDRLESSVGIRLNNYRHIGPWEEEGRNYSSAETVAQYWRPDIRAVLRYTLSTELVLKANASYNHQFIHLVSNSTSTLPSDIWVGSSRNIRPQAGRQIGLGLHWTSTAMPLEVILEIYHRQLDHQLDYADDFVDNFAEELESQFVRGKGTASGIELQVKKTKGRLTGWLSYAYARSFRSFEELEQGRQIPTVFDRPHDAALVMSYEINDRWSLAGTWVLNSGRRFTPIDNVFIIDRNLVSNYGPRNSARLETYHRMDISATVKSRPKKADSKWNSQWSFGVYNLYFRKNTFFTFTDFDVDLERGAASAQAKKIALFPFVPFVTWKTQLQL